MDITSPLKHISVVFVVLAFMGVLNYAYHTGHQDGYDDAKKEHVSGRVPLLTSAVYPLKVRPDSKYLRQAKPAVAKRPCSYPEAIVITEPPKLVD